MSENPIFSYTRRDYERSRQEGISKIPIISKGNWTDLNATDPGIILLDYVHALVDMLNYYQDHQALEAFITTAKERANIFRLAKQLSYHIRSSKGAICDVEFTSNLTYNYTVRIPKDTIVRTATGIQYMTMQDAYLRAGEHTVTIRCSQGVLNESTYTGTGISRFSNTSNATNQSIRIIGDHIDIDSISIHDNLGRVWTPVDYIVFSTATDRVYQIDLNPDDSVTIKFGDGERGVVPATTDALTISYITSSAEEGRVGQNTLTTLGSNIMNDRGQYLDFIVNNNKSSVGGSSSQSSEEIRDSAPGAIKAQNRAVTLQDFENLAKLVDGVSDARAYDINTKPELCLYHEVKVLIVPEDVSGAEEVLKQQVYNELYQKMIPPTNLQILTPSYIPINLSITVKKLGDAVESRLSYTIQEAVTKYFNERIGYIGEDFYPADLAAIISNLEDVRYVISITPSSPVNIADLSLATLGTVNITIQ